MPAKPVQISLDATLLARVDADEEARTRGRSAFVRVAIERYLAAKARDRTDAQIAAAYRNQADELREEIAGLSETQTWPDD